MAVECIDMPNGNREIAVYKSTNRLSTSYMGKDESQEKFVNRRNASDVRVEMICAKMALDIAGS